MVLLWATLVVRYHFEHKPLPETMMVRALLGFLLVCAVVFPLFRLQRGMWRFTALNDMVRLGLASATASVALVPLLFTVDRLADFPRSTPLILTPAAGRRLGRSGAWSCSSGGTETSQGCSGWRIATPCRRWWSARPRLSPAYLTALRRRSAKSHRVAGLIVTGEAATGRTIIGAEVLGDLSKLTTALAAVKQKEGRAPAVILAEPRPSRALLDQVIAASASEGAQVSRVRGDPGRADLAPVSAADLLARPARSLNIEAPQSLIAGKRVLVTGAGGTIGGELTRQVLEFNPSSLALVDSSEFNLYAIDHELRGAHPELFVDGRPLWSTYLADVRDEGRMASIFASERPQVVLHAAALKHVPLMEANPAEAVRTNVGGAIIVARLARDTAESFVFISTDKAVNPTNVMGATKRLAERAILSVAAGSPLKAAAVRFGNVLGSSGSVAPLFERQIAEGGPVTVTHPEMVRYFMSVQEAAGLVLQAAAIAKPCNGEGGCVFVLDMGDPVRIDDLARQMIALHGLRPGEDIEIRYTGLRPGEKLFEEVFYAAEAVRPTEAPGVLAAVDPAPAWATLGPQVNELLAIAVSQDAEATLSRLAILVPQFTRGG